MISGTLLFAHLFRKAILTINVPIFELSRHGTIYIPFISILFQPIRLKGSVLMYQFFNFQYTEYSFTIRNAFYRIYLEHCFISN